MGELQLRLTVPQGRRLQNVDSLRVSSACSEANVAGTVSLLGLRTQLVSMTAAGPVGDRAISEFRTAGVDVANVMRPENARVPLYFYEPADSPVPAEVYFDRLSTPFRDARPTDFDWPRAMDTRLFFSTGITAALTSQTASLVRDAFTGATNTGARTAYDVNYRAKLWSPESARAFAESILPTVDVLFCSHRDAATVFDVHGEPAKIAELLHKTLGVSAVVSTAGPDGCFAFADGASESAVVVPMPVRDRPGAGDAFIAGYLYGMLTDEDVATGLGFGVAASRIALSHFGDLVPISRRDLTASVGTDIIR
jgi:2-dehydro-3-deoxygluconokinase